METFVFQKVDLNQTELMQQIYKLRFEVYCRECGFIREEDYPDQIETDKFDPQSIHFAAFNSEGDIIGTIRMILPGEHPLPIQSHCPQIDFSQSSGGFVEISRLVISKRLRRRAEDERYYEPQIEDKIIKASDDTQFMRRVKPMAFGLYREMYQESKYRGIGHWYSLMEKSLWLLLRLHGFKFDQIGEEIDVYGPVHPYLGNIARIEEEVYRKFPKFYQYFVENLKSEYHRDFSDLKLNPIRS